MTRVAIYARFSSDVQNPRSIEDQVALCQRHAAARGWTVVTAFMDAAISGAHIVNRPGLLTALASAERGEFDVLLAEHEDRIARDLEHLAGAVKRLRHVGARLATLTCDHVETIQVAMNGAMAELYLANLSAKTKRGMHSNAEKGLATGSRVYGYRGQAGGQVAIVPDEAEVVREIFRRYAAGETGRAICADLNLRRLPGPRGGQWNPSTLTGNRTRGNGFLATELYAGVKVWNRIDMRKDPRTGERVSRARPPGEWKRTPVPELRIVTDEQWAAVQARRDSRAAVAPERRKRAPRGVFSGLIKCAECGASMTAFNSRGRLICAARREKGVAACTNDRSVERREVEARVLKGLRERLLTPAAVKAYVRLYHELWERKQAASRSEILPKRKRLAEIERAIGRFVDGIAAAGHSAALLERLKAAEAEKVTLAVELAEAERKAPPPLTMHPRLPEKYAARIAKLEAALGQVVDLQSPAWIEVVADVRDLVDRIDVRAIGDDGEVMVTLHGTLAAFLRPKDAGLSRPGEAAAVSPALGPPVPPRLYKVVAGARYRLVQTAPGALAIAC